MRPKMNLAEVEQRILEAAEELFLHYGYDKTTMSDVAREAGIAKSTLYTRYPRKDKLLIDLIWQRILVYIDDWIRRVEEDPEGGSFAGMYRNAFLAAHDNRLINAMFQNDQHLLGSFMKQIDVNSLYPQRQAFLISFIQTLQQAGVIRKDMDAAVLAYIANSLNYGIIQMSEMLKEDNIPSLEAVLSAAVVMIDRYAEPDGGANIEAGKRILREYVGHLSQSIQLHSRADTDQDNND